MEITGFRGPGSPPLYFSTGARVKRAMCARRGGEPGDEATIVGDGLGVCCVSVIMCMCIIEIYNGIRRDHDAHVCLI